MNGLQKACSKTKLYLHNNSSTILTVLGAIGLVTTVVMAVKATPKAMKLLDNAERFGEDDLTTIDKAVLVAPVYIPTVVMGTATIACMFGANVLSKNKQASLASAYALLDNYHKQYRKTLIDLHGKEADIEVRNEMAREHCNYHVIDNDFPDEKVLFYEELSGETIARYERDVIDAEYHFNRNFTMRGCASLNEFYEFLGIPQTEYGESIGWSMSSGIQWVDFEHRLISKDDGGTPVYAIDMVFAPDADYLEDWM